MRIPRLPLALTVSVAAAATVVGVPATASAAPGVIDVQLLLVNDFHGRLAETSGNDSLVSTEPGPDGAWGTADDVRVTVGGAAHLAATVQEQQAAFGDAANSFLVGVGDQIGASPFLSSVFRDEPTIEVLNAMGVDVAVVGNHEFDRGTDELRRITAPTDGAFTDDVTACEGVTPDVDGCWTDSTGRPFAGTDFPHLAANVVSRDTGEPMLPPYELLDIGGGRQMALIGVVTDTTPGIVSPAGIADVQFLDEADAVNRYVPELQDMGVEAIGVLLHEGGTNEGADAADPNGCADLTGPIVEINERIDPEVDMVLGAHTHQQFSCLVPGPDGEPRLVAEGGYYGRLLTDVRVQVDAETGEIDRAGTYSATNVPVLRDAADPTVAGIVGYWAERSAEAGDEVVGSATADILRGGDRGSARDVESPLGNLVAQMQLEAVQDEQFGDPVVAFMNPGGLREDLLAGDVTYAELFAVQPFGNTVNTITLTGGDIRQVLEEQFPSEARNSTLVLGTSENFRYSYDPARPAGDRVDPCSITIDGRLVDPAASYRVAANSFLITGGDFFAGFTNGSDPITGPVDVETAVAYFGANSPVAPPATDHATRTTERLSCGPAEVAATVTLSDDTPLRGQQVTVTGRDFAAGERVVLTVAGTRLGSAVADEAGAVVLTGRVPLATPAGQLEVTLTGDSGETATATATVAPAAQDARTVLTRALALLRTLLGGR